MKKKFKDRKIVQWAKENAPDLLGNTLEFVGDVTGIEVVENLGKKISGSNDLTPEQKAEALEILKLEYEHEKEITARWTSDMGSDSWLSKNIRPLIVGSCILMLFVFIILDSLNISFNVKDSWIELYTMLLIASVGGYFSMRTVEKYHNKKFK